MEKEYMEYDTLKMDNYLIPYLYYIIFDALISILIILIVFILGKL